MCVVTYCAGIVCGAMAMAAAPLIRVLGGLGIRVAAVHVIDTDLMCGSLEQLGPSDPKKEDKDQQQQDD